MRAKKLIGSVGVNAYRERVRKPYKNYEANAENAKICLNCDKKKCKGDCERLRKERTKGVKNEILR